jgi:hypothetical protein
MPAWSLSSALRYENSEIVLGMALDWRSAVRTVEIIQFL